MADRVGQRFGDYRLIRFLGQGGFGDVYLGEHVQNKTLAAIKVLKTDLKDETDLKELVAKLKEFINEASTFNLKHPHIAQLLAFGIGKDDTPFLVFEYAPNGSLRSHHRRGTCLPLATVVTYVKQIAAALQYAHDQRRIHRDVKPENILLGSTNEILLSDFGIATFAHSTDSWEEQKRTGTLAYMAPEQIQRKPQLASDQYALGVMVYEWLCGAPPFSGDMIQLMYQHLEVPPPPLREKVPTISAEVEQVVMTALAKEPQQRFGSVRAFANALEQAYKAKPPLGTTLLTYGGHVGGENAVAWSPDGRRIASGSDGTVQVWDATTGATLLTYRGHSSDVNTVAWSPDGRRIASGSSDKTVQVWDVTTGGNVSTYGGHSDDVNVVAWSPDGRRIASGSSDKTVQVWDTASASLLSIYRGHSSGVLAVAWSPDGHRITSASYGVHVWQAV